MITSRGNSAVRGVIALEKKAKERQARDAFVVEGIRMYREVPEESLQEVYISRQFQEKHPSFRPPSRVRFDVIADDIFESMSDTRTPQGIICVVRCYHWTRDDLMGREAGQLSDKNSSGEDDLPADKSSAGAHEPLIAALENIQDPGNLGTIFRSAEAAGATGILLDQDCCDVYNPKVIRATMGAIFRMPFVIAGDFRRELKDMQQQGLSVYAAHLKGSVPYTEPSYIKGSVLLIGNEGNGLTDETAAIADTRIRIPMKGKAESLNASVAASVLLYEAMRQREA